MRMLRPQSRLRTMLHATMLVVVSLSVWGCDKAEDVSDAERLVGTWTMVGVSDNNGDQLATFNATYNSFVVTFSGNGNATIAVDAKNAADDVTVSGTYAVDEADGELTITVNVGGVQLNLPFDYDFESDTRITVTTNAIPLNVAFGTTLVGSAVITLASS